MKTFEIPTIVCSKFSAEEILTTSTIIPDNGGSLSSPNSVLNVMDQLELERDQLNVLLWFN